MRAREIQQHVQYEAVEARDHSIQEPREVEGLVVQERRASYNCARRALRVHDILSASAHIARGV